jgi:hypothetical protein
MKLRRLVDMMISSSADLYLYERMSLVDDVVGRTREHDEHFGRRVLGIILLHWLVVDGGGVCGRELSRARDLDPYNCAVHFHSRTPRPHLFWTHALC